MRLESLVLILIMTERTPSLNIKQSRLGKK